MEPESSDSGSDSPHLPEDNSIVTQFIENMGLHFEDYEVSRIGGRMIGLMMLATGPLSSEDMAEALQVSRSSISTNLKTLLSDDLVEKVSLPGDRVDYYVIEPDFWQKILEHRLTSLLTVREAAQEGLVGLGQDDPVRPHLETIIKSLNVVDEIVQRLRKEWQSHQEVPALTRGT